MPKQMKKALAIRVTKNPMSKNMAPKQVLSDAEIKEYEIKFKTLVPRMEHFSLNGKFAIKRFNIHMMMRSEGMKADLAVWEIYYEKWLKELGYSDSIFHKEAGKRGAQVHVKL